MSLSHSPQSRRNFLQWFFGAFAALWSVLALFPIYRYLRPSGQSAAATNVSSVGLGKATALPVGEGKNFEFGSIPGIITHTESGFHAFNAICTHLGCTVQFRQDMGQIWCACHGGTYDPNTGEVLAGPPPRPLEALKVTETNGNLVVSKP